MRVSVIIPCLDAVAFVGEAIDAALAQTHGDVEIIVVDDGSTDGSLDVVAAYGDRVRHERLAHGGAPRARNHGLRLATGDAAVFLDADDVIAPDVIARSLEMLKTTRGRSLVAAPWSYLVNRDGRWVPRRHDVPPAPHGDPLAGWLVRRYHATASLLWPMQLVRDLGGWDETLTKNQDGDIAMRAFIAGAGLAFSLGRGQAYYRHYGPGSASLASRIRRCDVESCIRVIDKVALGLREIGRFEPYRVWVARGYHELARLYYFVEPDLARAAAQRADDLAGRAAIWGTVPHRVATNVLGLERKEQLAAWLARLGVGARLRRTRASDVKG